MSGRSLHAMRRRRSPSRRHSRSRNRILRGEPLEPRMLLSGQTVWGAAALVGAAMPVGANTAPTVDQAITINNNAPITGRTAALSVLGKDNGGESKLVYTWSVTAAPLGGTALFSTNGNNMAKNVTATFSKLGTYQFSVRITDTSNLSVTTSKSAVVSSALAGFVLGTASGALVASGATVNVAAASQAWVAQGLDQFGNVLAAQPAFTWSITSTPTGVTPPTLSVRANTATVTFANTGSYGLKVQATGTPLAAGVLMNVISAVGAIRTTSTVPVVISGTAFQPTIPTFVDQFGNVMATPALTWSTTTAPQGAPAPSFSTTGTATAVTFGMAGNYLLTARVTGMSWFSFVSSVTVKQALTTIAVSPAVGNVFQGSTQQFAAQALDQFGRAMATQPTFTWSTNAGWITTVGLFTAPSTGSSATITAQGGGLSATATVNLVATIGNLQSPALAALVRSLDVDGSINRQDMLQILRSTGADGKVDATEFSDLKKILSQAAILNMPDYVKVLASDVVNGNAANATYQGQKLGNLAAGSSATQLTSLINKWFLGTDHPTLSDTSLVYRSTAGWLFPQTPSHLDEVQGLLGDCYFITGLGSLADSNPAAVQNMFIDNGDGTFTVRFYTGSYGIAGYYSDGGMSDGFTNNAGTADYVTVDRMLPTSANGLLAYAGYGASYTNGLNALWIPLAEKAYAQWNQTGKAGRDGTNAYTSIEAGWMAAVDAQVLGHNATDYVMTTAPEQVAIAALAANEAVSIGTQNFAGSPYGLYSNHAYAVTGYNAGTDTFTLYNPWGSYQPGALSWTQLQATCTQLCVCDTGGSVPTVGKGSAAATTRASFGRALDVAATLSPALAGEAAAPTAATPVTDGSSAAGNAARSVFAAFDYHAALPWQPHHVASPVRASLIDATLLADDLWLPDEALAALV